MDHWEDWEEELWKKKEKERIKQEKIGWAIVVITGGVIWVCAKVWIG